MKHIIYALLSAMFCCFAFVSCDKDDKNDDPKQEQDNGNGNESSATPTDSITDIQPADTIPSIDNDTISKDTFTSEFLVFFNTEQFIRAYRNNPNAVLIDVRPTEIADSDPIPEAINIPIMDAQNNIDYQYLDDIENGWAHNVLAKVGDTAKYVCICSNNFQHFHILGNRISAIGFDKTHIIICNAEISEIQSSLKNN